MQGTVSRFFDSATRTYSIRFKGVSKAMTEKLATVAGVEVVDPDR
jgi:hypothetical protein